MSDAARAHYDRGIELFTAKDYAGAIRELEAGHAIDPRREFLFAEAQALRLQGDCKRAVPLYQQFLASDPTPVQVNATQIALSRCAQQLATDAQNNTSTSTRTDTNTSTETDTRTNTSTRPANAPPPPSWYRDPLAGLLLGAGVLSLGVGTGFLVASTSARDDANQATTYPDYNRHWETALSRQNVAVAGLVAGGALTAAALYRYVREWRHEREHQREANAAPKPAALRAWLTPGASGPVVVLGGWF